RRDENVYRITTISPEAGITRDGETAAVGEALGDGDTFYFGETGVRLRAFALTEADDITVSLRLGANVLANARPATLTTARLAGTAADGTEAISKGRRSAPRTDVAIVFVKQLLRELVAEIPRGVLYTIAGIACVIALGLLTIISVNTLGFLEGRRN